MARVQLCRPLCAILTGTPQGLEWVANNHIKPAVVHMSIEGSFSSVVNQAVEQLIKIHHVHVVVSSGDANAAAAACPMPVKAYVLQHVANSGLQEHKGMHLSNRAGCSAQHCALPCMHAHREQWQRCLPCLPSQRSLSRHCGSH